MEPLLALTGAAAAAASVAAGYLSPAAWKPLAIRNLRRRAVARRALVLTYDDGPGPATTEALLDVLHEFNAPATFFPSGGRLREHRSVAARIHREGHELGSHGFDHLHAWKHSPAALRDDYAKGCAAARTAGAGDPIPFRPPHGKLVFPTWLLARHLGTPLAWWTDDSGDSHPELPARSPALDLVQRGGGVVLLHDLDRSEPRNVFVLETTRALLQGARENGLTVMRFGDLLGG